MGRAGSASGSVGSARSSGSSYRTLAKGSYVDEGLFASSHNRSRSSSSSPTKQLQDGSAATQQGASTLSPYRSALVKTQRQAEVVALSECDIQRMMAGPDILTSEQRSSLRHAADERAEHERAAAKARKANMLQLAAEAQRQAAPSESELVQTAAVSATMGRAQALLQEEKDEVKHMNKMVRYAKCAALRERQVEEKKAAAAAEAAEQQRLDLLMELERQKALRALQARDTERRHKHARGAAVLQQQLAEREAARLREEELRDQELQALARELQRLQQEEAAAAADKRQHTADLMAEVAASNAAQIARKHELAKQERAEEARIADYLRQKDAREQRLAAHKAAIAHEKEMDVARLRAMQEKVQDTRSQEDELRARRYQEAKDREWRAKEAASAARQAAMTADLAAAREAQMQRKLLERAALAEVEQAEFLRVLAATCEKQAADASTAATQRHLSEAYKRDLLGQIEARREAECAERQSYLEEGRRVRQAQAQEKAVLEAIKAQKLSELVATVPAKYAADLARMKINTAR